MSGPAELVCTGQPVRRYDNIPRGEPCTNRYPITEQQTITSARVAGWCVGPARRDGTRPVMCPDCRRPGLVDDTVGPAALEPLPGL